MRRDSAGRVPRKYPTLEDAVARMKEENKHLDDAQARHLTVHGAIQNEDGTWSWKFDNAVRLGGGPGGLPHEDQHVIWSRITAPVLLVRGTESWASDPVDRRTHRSLHRTRSWSTSNTPATGRITTGSMFSWNT